MITSTTAQSPRDWATEHFGGAEFTDVRRVERARFIAEGMAASPGASFTQMFAHPYDIKATYEFLKNPDVTPDNLLAGHWDRTRDALNAPGRFLLLEDTSEIRCSDDGNDILGLGPIGPGKGGNVGFHLHSTLAVLWPEKPDTAPPRRPHVEIIGLADQQSHVRTPREQKGHASLRRTLPAEKLESSLWEKASQRIGRAPDRPDTIWIKVGDRGADIYDHLIECGKQNHRHITRAAKDRILLDEQGKKAGKLFATAAATAPLGEISLDLRARPGQAARIATLAISVTPVVIRSPQKKGCGPGKRPPLSCRVVRVYEVNPPAGVKALEWFLLTDLPVNNFAEAAEVAQMYATRWLEEEFHKALKTGMDAEGGQLGTAGAWFACIALKSVAALRLITLREQMHLMPEAPAEASGLSEVELAVLRTRSRKELLTVREVALAIGRLGGHLNRRRDGLPGWITLWRGWVILETLVEGYEMGRKAEKRE
ncbi:MAG: IS4 family transposase [Blastocatellia bacterium]